MLLWELTPAAVEPEKIGEDVNSDGTVNIQDLVLVAGRLGQSGANSADVNGDGIVNIQDLVLVAGALGNSAAAPSLHLQSLDKLTAADVNKVAISKHSNWRLTDAKSLQGILFLQQLLEALTPKETALLPNYPNPFNPETWIPYHLAKASDVQIYNLRHQRCISTSIGSGTINGRGITRVGVMRRIGMVATNSVSGLQLASISINCRPTICRSCGKWLF